MWIPRKSYLQCILAGEALVTVTTGEWLDRQMNALVPLEIVVAVEALRALIAFERSVVLRVWLSLGMVSIHMLHMRCVATVVCRHHRRRHATNQSKLAVRVADVGQDRSWQRVLVRGTLVCIRRLNILWLERRDLSMPVCR